MFRRRNNELEVLLVHPSGPFFVRKDGGVWTISKGDAAPGEDLLTRALAFLSVASIRDGPRPMIPQPTRQKRIADDNTF